MRRNYNTIVTVLITGLVFINFLLYGKIISRSMPEPDLSAKVPHETVEASAEAVETSVIVPDTLPAGYRYLTATAADTASGPLILVNAAHPFVFGNVPTAVASEVAASVRYNKTASYAVDNIEIAMAVSAIRALNNMCDAFLTAGGSASQTVIVTEGLRTMEEQQAMVDYYVNLLGAEQTIAASPGFSEHHSGYAMDISTYNGSTKALFTGEGVYGWFYEHCPDYGYILRYPAGKEEITGISAESWHFRYVGVPHAKYITDNGLSLEEYVEILALHGFDDPLVMTDLNGASYSVYSVPVAADGEKIPVPDGVPGEKYTLSGDNNGHVIVTVKGV